MGQMDMPDAHQASSRVRRPVDRGRRQSCRLESSTCACQLLPQRCAALLAVPQLRERPREVCLSAALGRSGLLERAIPALCVASAGVHSVLQSQQLLPLHVTELDRRFSKHNSNSRPAGACSSLNLVAAAISLHPRRCACSQEQR